MQINFIFECSAGSCDKITDFNTKIFAFYVNLKSHIDLLLINDALVRIYLRLTF